ncbi:MAG: hypothetical protein JWN18_476 [Parcubacteria group bacterium]|nr:hypothetical protein [Parcubacteria group bacterium]
MRTSFQFIRFCTVGGVGLLVNLLVTYVGVAVFNIWYFWSYCIGVLAGWTASFVLNGLFTFPEAQRGSYIRKYSLFISSYIGIFATNAAMVYILTSKMSVHYFYSIIISAFATTLISYTINKHVIYKP